MPNLYDDADLEAIEARLATVRPDTPRLWGRMSVAGMLCHLADSFDLVLGVRPTARRPRIHERTFMRFFALHVPLRWPKGVKTSPEVDQEVGGTPPSSFERDMRRLQDAMRRFLSDIDPGRHEHPIFGALSREEWGRWGWLHMDHHLRQFGA